MYNHGDLTKEARAKLREKFETIINAFTIEGGLFIVPSPLRPVAHQMLHALHETRQAETKSEHDGEKVVAE
jgi:hypothetical protein